MASLRTSLQPSGFALHARQFQRLLALPAGIRYASTVPPPKPRLLEKPERFNPPSHPSRLRSKPRTYGAPLSERERQAQKTRKYPHMMPPEGTFMHWFLTNRSVHLWITLGILATLTTSIWFSDFIHTTPYADLLPPNSMFFAHPFSFVRRYIEVYDMHAGYISAQTAEMRKQKVEDVKKRAEYRKAHGLDEKEEGLFGGWTAKPDGPGELLAAADREGGVGASPVATDAPPVAQIQAPVQDVGAAAATEAAGETYVDFEGKTQPVKKKWFGIW